MTDKEFIKEVQDYIYNSYEDFKTYHARIIEMFDVFHRICINNHLKYCVAFGSLLARVRDKSVMLPWDPDFDVIIPFSEADELYNALKKELPDNMFVKYAVKDSDLGQYMMRIGIKGFDLDYLHLDVFFAIGLPKVGAEKFVRKMNYYCKVRISKYRTQYYGSKGIIFLKKMLNFLRYCYISRRFINRKLDSICHKYVLNNNTDCAVVAELNEVFKYDVVFPINLVKDSSGEYCAPNYPEEFLKKAYGNYKDYMPVESRFIEFYNWVSIMNKSH